MGRRAAAGWRSCVGSACAGAGSGPVSVAASLRRWLPSRLPPGGRSADVPCGAHSAEGGTERERVHHHAAAPCSGIAHAPGSALRRPAPLATQPAGGAPSRANGWPATPGAPAPGPSVGGCFPGAQRATSVRGGPRHQACCAPELEGRWWELRGAARESAAPRVTAPPWPKGLPREPVTSAAPAAALLRATAMRRRVSRRRGRKKSSSCETSKESKRQFSVLVSADQRLSSYCTSTKLRPGKLFRNVVINVNDMHGARCPT